MRVSIKLTPASQREFNATLRRYLEYSKRTLPESLNEKAYFILAGGPDSQGAIRLTHKSSADRIKADLGASTVQQMGKRGKLIKKWRTEINDRYGNTLAVKLVIAKLRKAGSAIPSAETLKAMAVKLVNARLYSIGFIRSGWLPALRRLARFSKYGRIKFGETGRQVGQPKGGVSLARASQNLSAKVIFWNSAGGESKHRGALQKYGGEGLSLAFQQETASMKAYIERKMKEGARKLGIRVR